MYTIAASNQKLGIDRMGWIQPDALLPAYLVKVWEVQLHVVGGLEIQ